MSERVAIMKGRGDSKIYAKMVNRDLSIEMDLYEFLNLVASEIGPVTWIIKDSTFRAKFDKAVASVVSEMKQASRQVV